MNKVLLKKTNYYLELVINEETNAGLIATRIVAYPRHSTKLRKAYDSGIEFASEDKSDKIKFGDIDFTMSIPQATNPESLEECFELLIHEYLGEV